MGAGDVPLKGVDTMWKHRFGRESGQRFVQWNQLKPLQAFFPARSFRHHEGDGDGDTGGGTGGGGGGAGGVGDPQGGAGGGAGAGGGHGDKSFTQSEVNALMKKEREKLEGKYKEQIRGQLDEVNKLRQQADLTEKQRKALDDRASTLETELLTEREKAEAEKRRSTDEHKRALDAVTTEAQSWKGRFETEMRNTSVLAAASEHKAYNPSQLLGLVGPMVVVDEILDETKKPTGRYRTVVKADVAEGDKVVQKVFAVADYVKHLKEKPEFQNLFLAERQGGTGYRPSSGGSGGGGEQLNSKQKIAAGLRSGQAAGAKRE